MMHVKPLRHVHLHLPERSEGEAKYWDSPFPYRTSECETEMSMKLT